LGLSITFRATWNVTVPAVPVLEPALQAINEPISPPMTSHLEGRLGNTITFPFRHNRYVFF
jgi:hypothetical protein